jgi:hypothetical protein
MPAMALGTAPDTTELHASHILALCVLGILSLFSLSELFLSALTSVKVRERPVAERQILSVFR